MVIAVALFLSFLPIFASSGTETCGTGGFQYAKHDLKSENTSDDRDDAFVEVSGAGTEYILGLKGSYVASVNGDHTFRLVQSVSFPSIGRPQYDR
jgi:hypothetical protein